MRAANVGRARVAFVLALLGVWGVAREAAAYVRYRTAMTMAPFAWPQTWVPLSVYPNSMTDVNGGMDLTSEQILGASQAAAAAWSADQNPCSFLVVTVESSAATPPIARYDYKNSLVFRTRNWCALADSNGTCSADYDASALAITSVFANKSNGQIRDADIEVNSVNFLWADLDVDPSARGKQDLQNALTHEMGHLIGLDHTCYMVAVPLDENGEPIAPLDEDGRPLPRCDSAPPDVMATTMFASAVPGDVEKRTLAPDDKRAICDMYPVANDPMKYPTTSTPPPGSEGCAVAAAPRGDEGGWSFLLSVGWLGALGALGAATRRRPRGR